MKRCLLAAALAAVLSIPASPARAAPPRGSDRLAVDLRAAAYAGAFSGRGVREDSGGQSVLEVSAKPRYEAGSFTLEVPLRLAHRQTFGAALSETRGSLGFAPWWQLSPRLRAGLDLEVLGAYRPGWPDLYQPAGVDLLPTDRYSYLAGRAGVQAYARPAARQHLRARYRVGLYDYRDDPAFVESSAYHLTPRDRLQHEIDLSWRVVQRSWAFALRADYGYRVYSTLRSRPPRPPPAVAPRQELHVFEPSAELELRPRGSRLDLSIGYGYELQRDPYQDYYSYGGHHPRVQVRFAATERLALGASWEGWYRTYEPGGTLRLDPGDTRRTDERTRLGAEAEYRLGGGVSLRAEADWVRRATNFLDYTTTYQIDFDYTNLSLLAGIAWRR